MSNGSAPGNAKWPGIVFLLTRGRRTQKELANLSGAHHMTVSYVLKQLKDEGLVREMPTPRTEPGRGRMPALWEWSA